MWRRLRSSPSMVVAIVSLVVAGFCLLYVMERPGTIAIGSPSPNGIRLVEWGYVGPERYDEWDSWREWGGYYPRPVKIWDSVEKTVPEGKAWIVIVSPAHAISEVAKEINCGNCSFPPDITGRFELGGKGHYSSAELPSGTYHDLDLLIDYKIFWRIDGRYGLYAGVPAVYLVLEVDSELQG